ncbi:YozE family protein [Enterococcus sp. LJL98]
MRKSFYAYLMTLKEVKVATIISQLAEDVSLDPQFPKQSQDYHEVSEYLELHTDYFPDLSLFDRLWEIYVEENM